VTARRPSSSPAAASKKAPVQTEATRRALAAAWRSRTATRASRATARVPGPPATRSVSLRVPPSAAVSTMTPLDMRTSPPVGETSRTS
jgi:hypothetical protein